MKLLVLLLLITNCVYCVILHDTRSMKWNGDCYELGEKISSKPYQKPPLGKISTESLNNVCSLSADENGLSTILKNAITTKTPLWKYSIKEYIGFFGPVLIVSDKCSVHSQFHISYTASNGKESTYNTDFQRDVASLSESDYVSLKSFYNKYGPYVASDIEYGLALTYATYSTELIGFNQTVYSGDSFPMSNSFSDNTYIRKSLDNPEVVQFKPKLLTEYLQEMKLVSELVITSLKTLDHPIDYGFTFDLMKNAIANLSICERNRLHVFGVSDQELITDSTATTQDDLQFFRNYYSWDYNNCNTDQRKYYHGTYENFIAKETDLFLFSLKSSLIFDKAIYGRIRQCKWPNPFRLEFFFSANRAYQDEEKNNMFMYGRIPMGYCSSLNHPDMVPLYRFANDDSGFHIYSLDIKHPNDKLQQVECYVYPVNTNLPERVCMELSKNV